MKIFVEISIWRHESSQILRSYSSCNDYTFFFNVHTNSFKAFVRPHKSTQLELQEPATKTFFEKEILVEIICSVKEDKNLNTRTIVMSKSSRIWRGEIICVWLVGHFMFIFLSAFLENRIINRISLLTEHDHGSVDSGFRISPQVCLSYPSRVHRHEDSLSVEK